MLFLVFSLPAHAGWKERLQSIQECIALESLLAFPGKLRIRYRNQLTVELTAFREREFFPAGRNETVLIGTEEYRELGTFIHPTPPGEGSPILVEKDGKKFVYKKVERPEIPLDEMEQIHNQMNEMGFPVLRIEMRTSRGLLFKYHEGYTVLELQNLRDQGKLDPIAYADIFRRYDLIADAAADYAREKFGRELSLH